MNIRDYIYRVRGSLKENSRDTRYSNRLIWSAVLSVARKLMARDFHKLGNQDIFVRFDLEAEEVNLLSSCVPIDCDVCRVKLPDTVDTKHGLIYQYIGSPDFSESFTIVSPGQFRNLQNIRGPKKNYGFMDSGYLYLSKCFPCIVAMLPAEADTCNKLTSKAPIPDYLMDDVIKLTMQEISSTFGKPDDIVANKNDRS